MLHFTIACSILLYPLSLSERAQKATHITPPHRLTLCRKVKAKAWSPRNIDIDILAYGQLHLETEKLSLPHPRIAERDFVLQPLADIAPNFELHGKSIDTWLDELPVVELTRIENKLI